MASGTDDFNRTDANPLDGSWSSVVGAWELITNAVRQRTGVGAFYFVRHTTDPTNNDHYAEADVLTFSDGSTGVGVGVRGSKVAMTAYGYVLYGGDSSYGSYFLAGVETVLATGGAVSASTSYINNRLDATGTTLTGTRNGSADLSFTHSSLASGVCGMIAYNGNSSGSVPRLDNFDWADAGGAAGQPTMKRWGGVPHLPSYNSLQGGKVWFTRLLATIISVSLRLMSAPHGAGVAGLSTARPLRVSALPAPRS